MWSRRLSRQEMTLNAVKKQFVKPRGDLINLFCCWCQSHQLTPLEWCHYQVSLLRCTRGVCPRVLMFMCALSCNSICWQTQYNYCVLLQLTNYVHTAPAQSTSSIKLNLDFNDLRAAKLVHLVCCKSELRLKMRLYSSQFSTSLSDTDNECTKTFSICPCCIGSVWCNVNLFFVYRVCWTDNINLGVYLLLISNQNLQGHDLKAGQLLYAAN